MGELASRDEKINSYKILVGKHKGKKQIWRYMRRWKDNIKVSLIETECDGVTGVRWLRAGSSSGNETSGSIKVGITIVSRKIAPWS